MRVKCDAALAAIELNLPGSRQRVGRILGFVNSGENECRDNRFGDNVSEEDESSEDTGLEEDREDEFDVEGERNLDTDMRMADAEEEDQDSDSIRYEELLRSRAPATTSQAGISNATIVKISLKNKSGLSADGRSDGAPSSTTVRETEMLSHGKRGCTESVSVSNISTGLSRLTFQRKEHSTNKRSRSECSPAADDKTDSEGGEGEPSYVQRIGNKRGKRAKDMGSERPVKKSRK